MLNLAPIFHYANDAFAEFGEYLNVPPLPTAVYMMQRDVINHYRHAATHYLPISLSEPYLQNSSFGTPYEKWAKFTNDDFELLDFACLNLMRYTSRLVYSTTYNALRESNRAREIKDRCDLLTSPIGDRKYNAKRIGVLVNENQTLSIFRFNDQIEQQTIDISDRSILELYQTKCLHEADKLEKLNWSFGRSCGDKACSPYDSLNQSFWI